MINLISLEGSSRFTLVDDIPWGTHFCLFYESKEDLIDILVPYFKEGLENNEYCMWVTSEPLNKKEAERAIRNAIPDFDKYLKRIQIEIISYTEWYLLNNEFDSDRVLDGWVDKCNLAQENGFEGLRLTGNTFWLEKKDWNDFRDYEEEVNRVIGNYRVKAICTYSLEKCGPFELLDVIKNHQFALIRRDGTWESFKSMEQIELERKLKESEERYRTLISNIPGVVYRCDENWKMLFISDPFLEICGYPKSDFIGDGAKTFNSIMHPDDIQMVEEIASDCINKKIPIDVDYRIIHADGTIRYIHDRAQGIFNENNKLVWYDGVYFDITEKK